MSDLEDILNGDEGSEPIVEQVAEPVVEQPRADDGKFAAKGVEESAPPAPVVEQLPPDEYKALKAEREKRQELERRLAALEQPPQAPPPSIWDDEQGFTSHLESNVTQKAVGAATFHARLDMSEMLTRQQHTDFEEVKAEFLTLAAENPVLAQQAIADPHPWQKAYTIAKNARTMRELGATDIETLKAKIREDLLAEQAKAPPVVIPQSLAAEQSSKGGSPGFVVPSLKEILGG
jgi:hypothetical protein